MKLSDIEWQDLHFEAESHRGDAEQEISGIISAGRPFAADAVALARAGSTVLEPEVQPLLDTHDFFYLRFPLNIRPAAAYDVRLISLDIRLISDNKDAICWSMDPLRVEEEMKLTSQAGLSGKLSVKLLELGGEESSGEEYVLYQPVIEAFGLGEPNPAWELRPTQGRRLSGVQLFHMVVQVKKKIAARAEVMMQVDIFKKGLLWSYRLNKGGGQRQLFSVDFTDLLAH